MMAFYRGHLALLTLLTAAACAPRPAAPHPDRGAVAAHANAVTPAGGAATVFTDTALFRRVCLQADSGLTPAARRCTPRDQRVEVK